MLNPIVLIAFILSGFSSLTLETIWIRYLEHVFGATTLAVSTVLTCFMGGMAIGSWLFGKYADRIKSPVLAYGIAEGIVGVCAFIIPFVIHQFFPVVNTWMNAHLQNSFLSFSLVRFLVVSLLLIIPTTCMGATLPLLSRYYINHQNHMKNVGEKIGTLYTLNLIGAVLGVFFTTFLFLKTIGLMATNLTAGFINIALFVMIWVYRRRLEELPKAAQADEELKEELMAVVRKEAVAPIESSALARWVVMGVFFLSGLASMNLQVVWNRVMAMVIGSSVYSFAIVLIAFLVGLTIGSAAFSRISRRVRNPVLLLGAVQLAIAGLAMISYLFMDDLPRVFTLMVTGTIDQYSENVGLIQFIMFIIAAMAVLPVTIGMGATFPLTIKAVSTSFKSVGKDVGGVYALNTLGAICGSFLSAFVFVPVFSRYAGGFGMQMSYFLSVAIYVVSGVAILLVSPGVRWPSRAVVATGLAALSLVYFFRVEPWDPIKLTIGVFRLSIMDDALDEETWGEPDVRYYHDGVTTTVSIEMWGRHIALKNNGKVDASNGDDMPTQVMVSAYPLMFHPHGPDDLDVAIIGFGSGVTVGSALQFPVQSIDCVELESAVIEASAVFGRMEDVPYDPEFDVNHIVYRRQDSPQFNWSDPNSFILNDRLKVYANDGRNFLATRKQKYDVIISEPSNPWITGVSNMFTLDSFKSSSESLKKDGVFAQWVQLYEMSPQNIRTIFRTFAQVYPYVMLFSAEDLSSDTVLLGSFSPFDFNVERIQKLFEDEKIRTEMNRAYIFNAEDVFARVLIASKDEVLQYTSEGHKKGDVPLPINTDDNAYIEFAAPKDLISFSEYAGYLATVYTPRWHYGELTERLNLPDDVVYRARVYAQMAVSLLMNGRQRKAERFIRKALKEDNSLAEVRRARQMVNLLGGYQNVSITAVESPVFSAGVSESVQREVETTYHDIMLAIEQKQYPLALGFFLNLETELWKQGGAPMMHLKGYLHFLNADPADSTECRYAIEVLSELVRQSSDYVVRHPDVYYFLGLCHDNDLNFDKAVKNVARYVDYLMESERKEQLRQRQMNANMTFQLNGNEGTAVIPLPSDASGAPTTDAGSESPKTVWLEPSR